MENRPNSYSTITQQVDKLHGQLRTLVSVVHVPESHAETLATAWSVVGDAQPGYEVEVRCLLQPVNAEEISGIGADGGSTIIEPGRSFSSVALNAQPYRHNRSLYLPVEPSEHGFMSIKIPIVHPRIDEVYSTAPTFAIPIRFTSV